MHLAQSPPIDRQALQQHVDRSRHTAQLPVGEPRGPRPRTQFTAPYLVGGALQIADRPQRQRHERDVHCDRQQHFGDDQAVCRPFAARAGEQKEPDA
jgi:hypothetical protein